MEEEAKGICHVVSERRGRRRNTRNLDGQRLK